jgi:hypothetical protein
MAFERLKRTRATRLCRLRVGCGHESRRVCLEMSRRVPLWALRKLLPYLQAAWPAPHGLGFIHDARRRYAACNRSHEIAVANRLPSMATVLGRRRPGTRAETVILRGLLFVRDHARPRTGGFESRWGYQNRPYFSCASNLPTAELS